MMVKMINNHKVWLFLPWVSRWLTRTRSKANFTQAFERSNRAHITRKVGFPRESALLVGVSTRLLLPQVFSYVLPPAWTRCFPTGLGLVKMEKTGDLFTSSTHISQFSCKMGVNGREKRVIGTQDELRKNPMIFCVSDESQRYHEELPNRLQNVKSSSACTLGHS